MSYEKCNTLLRNQDFHLSYGENDMLAIFTICHTKIIYFSINLNTSSVLVLRMYQNKSPNKSPLGLCKTQVDQTLNMFFLNLHRSVIVCQQKVKVLVAEPEKDKIAE